MRMVGRTVVSTCLLMSVVSTGRADGNGSSGCAKNQLEVGRRIERTIEVGGVTREFILDVPSSVKAGHPAPLVFDFHGFGHSGAGVWSVSKFRDLAERERFITVYPTGLPITIELLGRERTGPGWRMEASEDNRDVAFTLAMLAEIEASHCIDRDRVYSTGFSNGAFFSNLLGCAQSERFAAVAPVSGGMVRGDCKPERPVPILIQHGTRDELISLDAARASRDQWLAANGCGKSEANQPAGAACQTYSQCRAEVVYCEEDYAHRWPPQATERIWTFLKSHSRSLGQERDPG
jgi:polyhydroxybutyrate depolymerase